MGMTCSIVVPIWGPPELTDACLESLSWSCSDAAVILVDNTGVYQPQHAPAMIFRNKENEGFAKACNRGAKAANTDITVFFNCDATGTFDWLSDLLETFNDPAVMMAGPKIVHPAGDLQTSGIRTWHGLGSAGGEEIKQDLPTRDVDGVTGACMAVRTDVFLGFGGFDEGFCNGYEDVDMCLQFREAAYRIRYVAESTVIHHESGTGPERWDHVYENIALMNTKWGAR